MLKMFCDDVVLTSVEFSNGLLIPLLLLFHGTVILEQGYFQVLFSCIERLLAFLNVKWLVLPAAHEAESIWTQKFGFERMPVEQVCAVIPCLLLLSHLHLSVLDVIILCPLFCSLATLEKHVGKC